MERKDIERLIELKKIIRGTINDEIRELEHELFSLPAKAEATEVKDNERTMDK